MRRLAGVIIGQFYAHFLCHVCLGQHSTAQHSVSFILMTLYIVYYDKEQ